VSASAVAVALLVAQLSAQQAAQEQIVSPMLSVIEQLMKSRSQEQPQTSMRKIDLPPGNDLEVLHVDGQVYMIAGGAAHSNITVQIGSEGVFLVDSATDAVSDKVLQAIRTLSKGPINYIVNTTADIDHYGGNAKLGGAGQNPTLGQPGVGGRVAGGGLAGDGQQGGGGNNPNQLRPSGAIVFSHENTLNRLSAPTGQESPAPFALWPTSTFFTPIKTVFFNDEPVELKYAANAHTDGDVMVFFRRSDVIAAGDVIDTLGYPRIDLERGGSIAGELDALNEIIEMTVPRFNQQGGTKVIPGHGRILNEADVVEYRDMNTIIRDRVKLAIDKGLSLEQLQKMGPTLDYDGLYSRPGWTGAMYVNAIYNDLRRPAGTASR
jgi:glyoxylase-like metal-dependent hydrolase (beta-lactamase superfamily II)